MATKKLLFVHGFMGSALNWGRIRSQLERRLAQEGHKIETFAFDLLGHASNHPAVAPSDAHLALIDDLEQQIDSKIGAPCVALGHSFGLRPLLLLSHRRKDLFEEIIAEDTSPEIGPEAYAFLKEVLNSPPFPFKSREESKSYFDTKYGAESALSRFLQSNIKSKDPETHVWRFDQNFLDKLLEESLKAPLWKEWENFEGKLSLIYGQKSSYADPSLLNTLKDKRKPRELKMLMVENAGHWIHADQPDDFVEKLLLLLT